MGNTENGSAARRRPRNLTLVLLGALAAFVFVACSPADAGPGTPDPTQFKPAATLVMELDNELDFVYYPGADLTNLEWDIELKYVTREIADVYAHYHGVFEGLGFTRTGYDPESGEIDAEYINANGVEISIELERDDGRLDVEIDIDAPGVYSAEEAANPSPTSFLGMDIPVYPGVAIRDVEWDYNFDHPGSEAEQVFQHYDEQLRNRRWELTEIDDDGGEWEADYRQPNRVHLELEVEREGGLTEVEFELNKARFYPTAE